MATRGAGEVLKKKKTLYLYISKLESAEKAIMSICDYVLHYRYSKCEMVHYRSTQFLTFHSFHVCVLLLILLLLLLLLACCCCCWCCCFCILFLFFFFFLFQMYSGRMRCLYVYGMSDYNSCFSANFSMLLCICFVVFVCF